MANFDELIPKVGNWDVEEEEMLINKIKSMTEDYQQKCSDLSINLNNINRNLHLIEVDFFNALNGLKTLSGTKFMEHVVDTDDQKPEEEKNEDVTPVEENIKDEHFNNVNNILQRSFDFLALRDQQKSQNKNSQEDDTISMNSKLMDNNLTKNNRGLKLPLIIGSNDFLQNDYIGLVNDEDEEEEENFNNEIKNEVDIPAPPENNQGEIALGNNPEDFHNMIQKNMGKPQQRQSMFDEGNKENEKEFANPALAMEVDEQEDDGLGGLLRSSSVKKPNPNNVILMNNMGMGMNANNNVNRTSALPNPTISATGGKGPMLANFVGNNFFNDDDDDDASGLFSRPGKNRGAMGMSMVLPGMPGNNILNNNINNNQMMNNQNQMFDNQILNNQNQMINNQILNNQNQMINNQIPEIDVQNNNKNIIQNTIINQQMPQEQLPQESEKLPLNQRMVMVPNPLLLAKQIQNIQPKIQQDMQLQMQNQLQDQNQVIAKNQEEEKNNNNLYNNQEPKNFKEKLSNIEKLFSSQQNMANMNNQNQIQNHNQNILMNQENNVDNNNNKIDMNINMDMNMNMGMTMNMVNNVFNQNQNSGMNSFMTQKEIENNQKLEKAKSKLSSIFGDDDDEDDDIFSKKTTNKAEKIEEKSQNLQERLNLLTSEPPKNNINNNKINDIFSMDSNQNSDTNSTTRILLNNANIITNTSVKISKKKAFFEDEDDEDFQIPIKQNDNININQNVQNVQCTQNIQNNQNLQNQVNAQIIKQNVEKNEPRIIMPKQMGVNLFQDQNNQAPVAKKKISLFDDINNNETNNINVNKDINRQSNQIKAPSSLFEGIDTNSKPENKVEHKPIPEINNPEKKKLPAFLFDDEEKDNIQFKPNLQSKSQQMPQPQIQPQQQPHSQTQQQPNPQPQTQEQPPKKDNLFSNLDSHNPVKKKASLFDILDTNPRQTIANTNINTRENLNKKEENIQRISKPDEEKKRLSVFESSNSKKTGGNKMASRFEQMLQDQKKEERKSVHAPHAPPKKLDFASKISNLQNVLGGRMAMGGNVFTMPTGGIKSVTNVGADIVHENGEENTDMENIKTEVKEISTENTNAILEDTKIQETSYEKQLAKKKENTVVVKKKKPKKINFNVESNENYENKEQENKNENISNMFNFENNSQINVQNPLQVESVNQEKSKSVPPKIDLFGDMKPKEKKPISLNNLFDNDNVNNNVNNTNTKSIESKPSANINNLFNEPPKTTTSNINNLFNDNANNNNEIQKVKPKLNMNDLFNEKPKETRPPLNIDNLFNNKKQTQNNDETVVDNQPKLMNIPNNNQENKLNNLEFKNNTYLNPSNNIFNHENSIQNQEKEIQLPQKINLFGEEKPKEEKPIQLPPKIDLFSEVKPKEEKPLEIKNNQHNLLNSNVNNLFNENSNNLNMNANNILNNNKSQQEQNFQKIQKMNNLFENNSQNQQTIQNINLNNNMSNETNKPQNIISNNFLSMNNNNKNQTTIVNNLFIEQKPEENNNLQLNINLNDKNMQIQANSQPQQNIFIQENNIIKNTQQTNYETDSQQIFNNNTQPKKQFKSMFEDDEDDKAVKRESITKNPIADKRLSFLFED